MTYPLWANVLAAGLALSLPLAYLRGVNVMRVFWERRLGSTR